jgi:tetratricopeptide (TPR) repeat protein
MIQRDYILRIAEDVGRALARILYRREVKDYQAAFGFIDDQLKQTVGMGLGFIHSVSEETLLSMFTSLGRVDVDKILFIAILLKTEGDIYVEQGSADESYYSYVKSLNLFLEVLLLNGTSHSSGGFPEVEELLGRLEEYELPRETEHLLFGYYEQVGNYAKAENVLFEIVEADATDDEVIEEGKAFYMRLKGKSDAALSAGNFSRERALDGLARLIRMVS